MLVSTLLPGPRGRARWWEYLCWCRSFEPPDEHCGGQAEHEANRLAAPPAGALGGVGFGAQRGQGRGLAHGAGHYAALRALMAHAIRCQSMAEQMAAQELVAQIQWTWPPALIVKMFISCINFPYLWLFFEV